MMQMIQLMPSQVTEYKIISEICEIISSVAIDSKDAKSMQKIAGDIEAIEKITDILLTQKL